MTREDYSAEAMLKRYGPSRFTASCWNRRSIMVKLDADVLPDLVFAALRMGLIKA